MQLLAPQKVLKPWLLVVVICLLNLSNPLATDMYAPAIPTMTNALHTSYSLVNLTMTLYFLGCAVSMLLSGPLTDKLGRKPVLITGSLLFTAGAFVCAATSSIGMLIAARIFSALGSGAIYSSITAVVKDSFGGKMRQTVLSAMIATQMIGPVIAPILGSLMLMAFSWRGIFCLLGIMGALGLVSALAYTETVGQRMDVGTFAALGRIFVVLRNRPFRKLLLAKSVYSAGWMGHVACGSMVYVTFFGCTELQYSLFFGALGIISAFVTYVCNAICARLGFVRSYSGLIVGAIIIGVALPILGPTSVWAFFAVMTVYCSFTNGMQAAAADVLLSQEDEDTGSVSALMNFAVFIFGTIGMGAMALPCWPNYFVALSATILVTFAIGAVAWVLLIRSGELKGL